MNRFPRRVVLFADRAADAPIVFYELRTHEAFRQLNSGVFAKHPLGEVSTEWSPRRFHAFRRELERKGIPALAFRESRHGTWVYVAPSAGRPQDARDASRAFLPSLAAR